MGLRIWTLSAALVASVASLASATPTFTEKVALVYDSAPKVRIAGTDFDQLNPDKLNLSFAPKLRGKDYTVSIQSPTVMVLTLKPGMKWMKLDVGASPAPLYLTGVKSEGTALIEDSVQIATIVPSPTVEASSKEIYMSVTPKLIVNGTNFNVKTTELYFDPPLQEGTAIQKQVLSPTQILLNRLYKVDDPVLWAPEPGPLKLVAINTGAGRLQLNPEDGGVVIAEVQADLGGHGVSVVNHESLDIYQSTKSIKIAGSGFAENTKVRFANALRGGGTNFTITDTQPDQLTLELVDGSRWRKNVDALPGALVLLAADAGDGWVPLGPTAAKAGRKVATVFEDPSIDASEIEIYRTHTHELQITGTGFNFVARPILDFDPPLDTSNANVYVDVVNRTMIRLNLGSTSAAWTSEDKLGPLTIKGMDTGAGMVVFDSPVTVATVVSDTDVHESGVAVYPMYGRSIYQSSKEPLHISGAGFKGEPVLNLYPAIWSPSNYTVTVVSETELKLEVAEGSKWSSSRGPLLVMGINVGDGDVELGGGAGVKVADILEDPVVNEGKLHIYTTHTKHFPVHGSGFDTLLDTVKPPVVVISGLSSSSYKIQENWRNTVMTLQLIEGHSWASVAEGSTTPLKILSIDTGAGVVSFPDGVEIAEVREDSTTALCEDSCTFADDGQCDEPGVAFGGSSMYGPSSYGSYFSDTPGYRQYGRGWGYDDDANSFLDNDYSMYQYVGYMTTYQYSGVSMSDDGFFGGMSPCEVGTDCTDCGVKVVADDTCMNTCQHARDGICDDPRSSGVCPGGTDCQDCGPWGESGSNFTETSVYQTSSWFDDDDWDLLLSDDAILYGQEMNAQPVYKRNWNDHKVIHKDAAGAGTIFVDVLWAMVVLVGCSMSLGGCMVAYRHFKAGGGGAPMYLPVQAAEEVELSRRTGGAEPTPDVVRIG